MLCSVAFHLSVDLGVVFLFLALAESSIQLVPDGTLLFHLVLVILMVVLLNATLLKPVNRILEERERRTKGRLGEAEAVFASVNEKLREYEERMREARARRYKMLEEERTAASKDSERKVAEVKAEVTGWLENEKRRLQEDEEEVRGDLTKDAGLRAKEIAGRILGRSVNL